MTRALIWDFDGTIVDTETTLFQAYAEAFALHGHELDRTRWLEIIGTDDDWDPLDDLALLVDGLDIEATHAHRRTRRDELIDLAGIRPGVLRWMDDADALGIPMGIASSSPSAWVDGHLDRLQLSHRFACLACCNDRIPAKPDPTSYRLACETLHADPLRSIAIEDSPHGIAAAKDAGLFVVAVPHDLTRELDLTRADVIVESLDALPLPDVIRLCGGTRP